MFDLKFLVFDEVGVFDLDFYSFGFLTREGGVDVVLVEFFEYGVWDLWVL